MLDLETLGLAPGSVLLSIGAVLFDRTTGDIPRSFHLKLESASQQNHGLVIDPSTEKWWSEQSEEARTKAFSDQDPASIVLDSFAEWYKDVDGLTVWANGSNFDVPLLEAAYKAFGKKVPWHYRAPRDVRTVFDLVGKTLGDYGTVNPLAHDALQDAIWQAKETAAAIKDLTKAA